MRRWSTMSPRLQKLCRDFRDENCFRQPSMDIPHEKVRILMSLMLSTESPQVAGECLALAREILYAAIPDDGRPLLQRIGDPCCCEIVQEFSCGHSRALRQSHRPPGSAE